MQRMLDIFQATGHIFRESFRVMTRNPDVMMDAA